MGGVSEPGFACAGFGALDASLTVGVPLAVCIELHDDIGRVVGCAAVEAHAFSLGRVEGRAVARVASHAGGVVPREHLVGVAGLAGSVGRDAGSRDPSTVRGARASEPVDGRAAGALVALQSHRIEEVPGGGAQRVGVDGAHAAGPVADDLRVRRWGERGGRCQRWDVGFEGDTREASRRIVHGRADEGRHIVGKVAVKRLQTAGLTSRAWRRGARRTVIWVLVCATAGAAPHSSATATSAIAIRLSMLTMEQSRASTLGGARNKLRSQRRSWAPTL